MNAALLSLALYYGLLSGTYESLIVGMGHQQFTVRENASRALLELGAEGYAIEDALERAARSLDAEVRQRSNTIFDQLSGLREQRRKAYAEEQLARRQAFEARLSRAADQLFPYYPYLDSVWYNRTINGFDTDRAYIKALKVRYLDGGPERVFDKVAFTDNRTVERQDQILWNLASKRMGMDMLSQGVSPLTINMIFQVMRVNDNLYLGKTLNPATTPVPEDIMPPAEDPKPGP